MSLTLTYPNQAGKSLYLGDTFYNTRAWDGYKWVYYRFHYVNGHYIHGGNDIHGAYGQLLVACYPGKIVWVNEGSAFGYHQFKIVASNGTEFHYKHTLDRPVNGRIVQRGQAVCHLGNSGTHNAHLHFEVRTDNNRNHVINPHQYLLQARAR